MENGVQSGIDRSAADWPGPAADRRLMEGRRFPADTFAGHFANAGRILPLLLLVSITTWFLLFTAVAQEHNPLDLPDAMTKAGASENGTIAIGGREIAYRRRAKGIIWFYFAELFERPRSQVDYLEIASSYHTVLVSGVRRR